MPSKGYAARVTLMTMFVAGFTILSKERGIHRLVFALTVE
jgi:hypothetical protein